MAYRRIVVGMDGSLASREALHWAGRLVRVIGGRIVVVHALEPADVPDAGPHPVDRHYVELTELLELDWCRELVRAAIPFSTVIRPGHPVDVISEAADLHQASLVLVGNRGLGTAPALGLGTTTRRMLAHGDRPLLVTPEPGVGTRHLALRHILVSLDGSAASERALGTVSDLAVAFGSRITLVRALGARARHGYPRPRVDPHLPRLARELSERGIPVRTVMQGGEADDVVREAAQALDADLVAVGARDAHDGCDGREGADARDGDGRDADGARDGDGGGPPAGHNRGNGRALAPETHRPTLVVPPAPRNPHDTAPPGAQGRRGLSDGDDAPDGAPSGTQPAAPGVGAAGPQPPGARNGRRRGRRPRWRRAGHRARRPGPAHA